MTDQVDVKVGAQTEGVEAGMRNAASVVQEAVSSMSSSMGGLATIAGAVSGAVQELTQRVLAGLGQALKRTVGDYQEAADETRALAEQMGTTKAEASALRASLDDIGMTTESFGGMAQRMTLRLRENEERFNQMGVVTRDANGQLLTGKDLIMNTVEALKNYKEGTDRQLAATELLGRGTQDLSKFLELSNSMLEDGMRTLEDFGAVMTQQDVEAVRKFKLTTNDLDDAISAMFTTIGRMLIPILTDLATIVRDVLPYAFVVLKGAIAGVLSFLSYLRLGFITIWELAKGLGQGLTDHLSGTFNALARFVQGDFTGAAAALKKGYVDAGNSVAASLARIGVEAEKTNKYVHGLFLPDGSADASKTGNKSWTGKPDKDKQTKDNGQFNEWRAELQRMKDESDVYRGLELKAEQAFWEEKVKLASDGSKDKQKAEHELSSVNRKIAQEALKDAIGNLELQKEAVAKNKAEVVKITEAKVALMRSIYGEDSKQFRDAEREKVKAVREAVEEQKRIQQEMLSHQASLNDLSLAQERQRIEHEAQMGLVTIDEKLRLLAEADEREYQMKRESLAKKAVLAEEDLLEHQRILNEKERLDFEYQMKVEKNQQMQALETKKTWDSVLGAVTSAVETSVKGIILGTTTMQKALANIGTAIVASFVNMGVQIVTDWIKRQIMMTIFHKTETAARTATDAAAALATSVSQKVAAAGAIAAHAAVAGAAGVASAAAIPIIGWQIAPGAGAMDYAAAMAYAPMVMASAEKGWWEVPGDQIMQVHKKEMVLPAQEAQAVRDMAEGGGGGGGGDTIQINAIDARSFRDFLKRESHNLAPGLRRMARNFTSVG